MISFSAPAASRIHTLIVSFFLASTVGIILYTMYAAFHYSSNAVLGRDEANFIILSSQKILNASNCRELIEGFFPSHGQHLLLGMQLVNIFTYETFGVLDRRIMNVIGVIILCTAALLLPGKLCKKKSEAILICAALFPLILSPAHNSCIVNASCTGNHYLGVAFSVVSLYFFTRTVQGKWAFVFAEFFMLLAIFSLPASLALIPVSFLILATTLKTDKTKFILFHSALILALLLFQYYLTYPNTILASMTSSGPTSLLDSMKEAMMFGATFLIILGSMFYWLHDMGHAWILVIIGIIVLTALVITLLKSCNYFRGDLHAFHLYGTILFLLMILIISFGRYYSLGSSRYAVYTAFLHAMLLLLIFSHLNASHELRRIRILICSATLSLIYFFVALHYHQPYLLDLEQKDEYCKQMWRTEGYVCGVMIPHEEATQIIKNAIDQGIYQIEK